MACIDTGINGLICKGHEGLLYHEDFTSPLAGRYTVLQDYGDPADNWQIVDTPAPSYWSLSGSKALRVRHDQSQDTIRMMIVNDEFPDLYKRDSLDRDFPWMEVAIDVAGVVDPNQFPYDLANGGFMHRVHNANTNHFSIIHRHRCGIFSTWVYTYMFNDAGYVENSGLVNLINDWWRIKHHVDDGYVVSDQLQPSGWSVGSDKWEPITKPYDGINGKFGFATSTCSSWTVDGYVYFRGARIVETNYVTIKNIPPRPRGGGEEGTLQGGIPIPGSPLPDGIWYFRCDHPNIGVTNETDTNLFNDETELVMSLDDNSVTWRSVQWYYVPYIAPGTLGNAVLLDEIFPTEGVNGGDIYCLGDDSCTNGGGGGEVSVQGGCAEYEQIWLHAPVLNDLESGFIPGDTHVYARQIKGFGALTITGDATLTIARYRGESPPLLTKTTTPVNNGNGSYDITVTLSAGETAQIGDQDAFHFQLQFTLSDGSVTTPNAGLIKGIPFKVAS